MQDKIMVSFVLCQNFSLCEPNTVFNPIFSYFLICTEWNRLQLCEHLLYRLFHITEHK